MAKAKITITGTLEKEPQIYKSKNVDLLLKVEPSTAVPKGLNPLRECLCTVHVGPKSWKKVADNVQSESKFLIQGEVTALRSRLEVVAFDIGLIEKKEQAGEAEEKKPAVMPVPKGTQRVIGCSEIILPEGYTPPALEAVQEVIAYIQTNGKFDQPIVLDASNVLIDGYAQYFAAGELSIERVPITCKPKEAPKPEPPQKKSQGGKKKPERSIPPMETWGIMPLADIQIPAKFLKAPPGHQKVKEVIEYIQANKRFDKPLFVSTSNWLVDGYKRYVAAKELQLENVPVVIEVLDSSPMEEQGESSRTEQELSCQKVPQEEHKEELIV